MKRQWKFRKVRLQLDREGHVTIFGWQRINPGSEECQYLHILRPVCINWVLFMCQILRQALGDMKINETGWGTSFPGASGLVEQNDLQARERAELLRTYTVLAEFEFSSQQPP